MGWFDEQIRQRAQRDQEVFEDALFHMAEAVLGRRSAGELQDERLLAKAAIDEVLKYYHYKPLDVPPHIKDPEEQIDYALRPYGLMRRNVRLEKGWQRDAFGPMIVYRREDMRPVAVLPKQTAGYYYKEGARKISIGEREAEGFWEDAVCFYRPLPLKSIGIPELILYLKDCISMGDMALFLTLTLLVVLSGMLLPRLTSLLTGRVLDSGNASFLWGTAAFILAVVLSTQLFSASRSLLLSRLQEKASLSVQAAVMMRLLGLPAAFFRKYPSGELQSRVSAVDQLSSLLLDAVFSTGISAVVSLLYITQIFRFAPALVWPSIGTILLSTLFFLAASLMQRRVSRQQMAFSAKASGISYALVSAVQKIKLSGAEKRAFAKWADAYAEEAAMIYDPPLFLKLHAAIDAAVSLAGTILLYYVAVRSGTSPSDYLAFSAAYGMLSGAFAALSSTALSIAQIGPILEMAEPILKETPEMSEGKEILTKLSGGVELNNVSFRYHAHMPYVIDGLSLKIRPGEYIAVVGRSGCGKSTLVRLLLGFEKPEKGAVYYDGKDLNSLDLQSLRRKIGAVTQEGGLFQGDIYSNITLSSPGLPLDAAWEAAELSGIAEDIRKMPMGMRTVISEGQGGISGGQKQRLMIARAVAPKPKLLIFDEATSALDNKTQRQVSEALDKMHCTRIVIAHRLSTIRHCSRILVLEGGKVIEDGSYDELLAKGGYFSELIKRQQIGV